MNEIIEVKERKVAVKQVADIDGFLAKRQEFIQKVNAICVEGKDYHIIQGKKSLAKGGAEKIASIFQWNAIFEKDSDSLEMLGQIVGLVAFKCTISKGNKFVGEGRGAASLTKNGGDSNKTLKMAQKSAFIDAVLRASGLSDFYTQDLEDMPESEISKPQTYTPTPVKQMPANGDFVIKNPSAPATQLQIKMIFDLAKQKGRPIKPAEEARIRAYTKGEASKTIETLLHSSAVIPKTGQAEDFPITEEEVEVVQEGMPTDKDLEEAGLM